MKVKYITNTVAWFLEPSDGHARYEGRESPDTAHVRIPENQRQYVWKLEKQRRLIDSIMRGFPIPALFLSYDRRSRTWYVQEGQQRLETLWRFYNGRFSFDGKCWADCTPAEQARFLDFHVPVIEIDHATDDELAEVFDRVNEGVALSPGEKYYNYRQKPLVALAERLLLTAGSGLHPEASQRLGDYLGRKDQRRNNYANAIGLVAGAAYGSDFITSAYVKIQTHLDGYHRADGTVEPIDEALVKERLGHVLDIYRRVDEVQNTTAKDRSSHWVIGKTSGYVLYSVIEAGDDLETVKETWVEFLKACRCDKRVLEQLYAGGSKANNLTRQRLEKGWENVQMWAAGEEVVEDTESGYSSEFSE
jgi:Protein of unknown function DUF262